MPDELPRLEARVLAPIRERDSFTTDHGSHTFRLRTSPAQWGEPWPTDAEADDASTAQWTFVDPFGQTSPRMVNAHTGRIWVDD